MLFVPGLNCPWFALHIPQCVDVFVGQDVECADVLLESSLLTLFMIHYLYSSIVRPVSSTCCRYGFCWGARVIHDAVVAVSSLCEGLYVLNFPVRTLSISHHHCMSDSCSSYNPLLCWTVLRLYMCWFYVGWTAKWTVESLAGDNMFVTVAICYALSALSSG